MCRNAAILSIFRDACSQQHFGPEFDPGSIFMDIELIEEFQWMNPANLLRLNRIMFFCRLVKKNPNGLLELVIKSAEFPRTWSNSVHADLAWTCFDPKLASCSGFTLGEWVSFLKTSVPWSRVCLVSFVCPANRFCQPACSVRARSSRRSDS